MKIEEFVSVDEFDPNKRRKGKTTLIHNIFTIRKKKNEQKIFISSM